MRAAEMKLNIQELGDLLDTVFDSKLAKRFDEPALAKCLKQVVPILEEFVSDSLKGKEFLSGEGEPMMIDVYSLPVFERIIMLEDSPLHSVFLEAEVS